MKTEPIKEDAEDLYQNAPFGYLTLRADGTIVNVNNTLLVWLNYERSEVVHQKSFQDLLGMGEKIYYETHIMPMLQMEGEVAEINIELKGREPIRLPVLINAKRIAFKTNSEPHFRISVLDISQRKQYEQELIKAKKEAEQTVQRLKQIAEDLEQFAYIASHDLQAPVKTIAGLISSLEKKVSFPIGSAEERYMSLIKKNARRMKTMVQDLLEYAKIDGKELEFEEVSLNEVCEIAIELIKEQVNENDAEIVISKLPVVVGDKIQLARLFQNLFSNAIKYRSDATPKIEVGFEDLGDVFRVFVRDNGMGFEQQFANQLFGFMQRLHSHDSIPGTGIGLSACKRIIEIHKGTIFAESALGNGSTFFFTFPK